MPVLVQPLHTYADADAIGGAPRCTCSTTKVHAFLPRVLALDRLVLPIGSHRLAPAHSKRCGQNHLSVGRAVPLHGTRLLRPIPAQLLPPAMTSQREVSVTRARAPFNPPAIDVTPYQSLTDVLV